MRENFPSSPSFAEVLWRFCRFFALALCVLKPQLACGRANPRPQATWLNLKRAANRIGPAERAPSQWSGGASACTFSASRPSVQTPGPHLGRSVSSRSSEFLSTAVDLELVRARRTCAQVEQDYAPRVGFYPSRPIRPRAAQPTRSVKVLCLTVHWVFVDYRALPKTGDIVWVVTNLSARKPQE